MSRSPRRPSPPRTGACLGVGLGLLIATDVVYVAETAKIGSPFAALGATLDSGGHALFFERLGAHKTLDLIYTGRLMSGDRGGAVAGSSPASSRRRGAADDDATPRRRAAHGADGRVPREQAARRADPRRAPRRCGSRSSIENAAQAALCDTDDYREGFAAFQQKRPPVFTGR